MSYAGATTHSTKPALEIAVAVLTSTFRFNPTMLPKADKLSQSQASLNAWWSVFASANPQGLVCFITTAVGFLKSLTILTAASKSRILLKICPVS